MESDKEFASHKILWLLKNFISERMVVTRNSLSEDYSHEPDDHSNKMRTISKEN